MSDRTGNEVSKQQLFPMVIAVTALILALVSGVVNYRQNNLSSLESSLRDTRVQLQLAKNDITDIKMNTINQLVQAELATKEQQQLKAENSQLKESLADATARVDELEAQIKRMDHKLVSTRASLKKVRKKQKRTAPQQARHAGKQSARMSMAELIKTTSLDIYTEGGTETLPAELKQQLSAMDFKPAFPAPSKSMKMANASTVFYYHKSYKPVAARLVKALSAITATNVVMRQGSSPFKHNKIIAHIIVNPAAK